MTYVWATVTLFSNSSYLSALNSYPKVTLLINDWYTRYLVNRKYCTLIPRVQYWHTNELIFGRLIGTGCALPLLPRQTTRSERQTPALHRPQNKWCFRRFLEQIHDWKHLYVPLYFSCTTFRNSAIPLATSLIRKCATRRWTPRCSRYSVAKRQQFSCPLRTA